MDYWPSEDMNVELPNSQEVQKLWESGALSRETLLIWMRSRLLDRQFKEAATNDPSEYKLEYEEISGNELSIISYTFSADRIINMECWGFTDDETSIREITIPEAIRKIFALPVSALASEHKSQAPVTSETETTKF